MASTISGRCLCGGVTYEYRGSVGPANYRHCEDCRRCTGSAFNIGVRFDLAGFSVTSGRQSRHTRRSNARQTQASELGWISRTLEPDRSKPG
jgi:hypothetical protein